MSQFLETIAIVNKIPQHVSYHQQRIDACSLVQIEPFLQRISFATNKLYKLSVIYNETQVEKYQLIPYQSKVIKTFKILIDNNLDYSFKFADRTHLDQLKSKKGSCDEIIIIKNEEVTDCSFANLIFWDGKRWITPENPLLAGTCRARLLEEGVIETQKISVKQLPSFSKMMLINAMLDFDEKRAILISPDIFVF